MLKRPQCNEKIDWHEGETEHMYMNLYRTITSFKSRMFGLYSVSSSKYIVDANILYIKINIDEIFF